MKKIITVLLAMLMLAVSACAEISTDTLDALSDAEKNILRINLGIAIANKENGTGGKKYSYQIGVDLMELSIDELQWMLDYISAKPDEESTEMDNLIGAVLCDYKLFTITVTDAQIRTHNLSDDIDLVLYVDIVNGNNFAYEGYIENVAVNDWQVDKLAWFNLNGGKKQKEKLVVKLNDIGVFELEDIETFSISFKLLYANYSAVTDEVVLQLK